MWVITITELLQVWNRTKKLVTQHNVQHLRNKCWLGPCFPPLFWNSYPVLWIFCIYFHVPALSLISNLFIIFSEFWNNSNVSFNSLTWHFAGSKLAAHGIHCVLISVVVFFISKLPFLISGGSFFITANEFPCCNLLPKLYDVNYKLEMS